MRFGRIQQMLVAVSIGVFVVMGASPAGATPIVDQSFTTPWDLGANINDACRFVGQSFTAGITGDLTAVNLDIKTSRGSALRVALRSASDDVPFGEPLAVRYLTNTQAPLTRMIAFHPVPIVAGRQYAIVVSYRGGQTGGVNGLGLWRGATGDVYGGGRMLAGGCTYGTGTFWYLPALWAPYDLHFRTYVEPAATG